MSVRPTSLTNYWNTSYSKLPKSVQKKLTHLHAEHTELDAKYTKLYKAHDELLAKQAKSHPKPIQTDQKQTDFFKNASYYAKIIATTGTAFGLAYLCTQLDYKNIQSYIQAYFSTATKDPISTAVAPYLPTGSALEVYSAKHLNPESCAARQKNYYLHDLRAKSKETMLSIIQEWQNHIKLLSKDENDVKTSDVFKAQSIHQAMKSFFALPNILEQLNILKQTYSSPNVAGLLPISKDITKQLTASLEKHALKQHTELLKTGSSNTLVEENPIFNFIKNFPVLYQVTATELRAAICHALDISIKQPTDLNANTSLNQAGIKELAEEISKYTNEILAHKNDYALNLQASKNGGCIPRPMYKKCNTFI